MNDEYITAKRELGEGRWDRKLRQNMTALSVADNYDDAKHEWIATGEVWWQGIRNKNQNCDNTDRDIDK